MEHTKSVNDWLMGTGVYIYDGYILASHDDCGLEIPLPNLAMPSACGNEVT
jgi:hypothetical protein